jgi:riboflavin biosynthesis pyrimidine reductase
VNDVLRRRFEAFVEKKTRKAEGALIRALETLEDRSTERRLRHIGNAWTRRLYGGDFHLIAAPFGLPAVSLTFVRSRSGNTSADDPETLGGGATDLHLIYEGLSRVAADAVLAGAATAVGPEIFFSVWHPALVALRRDLGLPRHPAQVVISNNGNVDLDALLFNVPEVPVFIVAGQECGRRCAAGLAARPWITVVSFTSSRVADALEQLRRDHCLMRISVVGGRTTASSLIEAGLVQDVCLTTTTREAGQPNTPFYAGKRPLTLDVIVRKRGSSDEGAPILFEHLAVVAPRIDAPSG